jgi:hypothetical protein
VGFMPPMGFPENPARRVAKPPPKPDQRHGRWTEEERVAPRPDPHQTPPSLPTHQHPNS